MVVVSIFSTTNNARGFPFPTSSPAFIVCRFFLWWPFWAVSNRFKKNQWNSFPFLPQHLFHLQTALTSYYLHTELSSWNCLLFHKSSGISLIGPGLRSTLTPAPAFELTYRASGTETSMLSQVLLSCWGLSEGSCLWFKPLSFGMFCYIAIAN